MKKKALFIATLIFVLSLNIYFRSFTINFPQLKNQARDIIGKSIQQSAMMEVQKKFPQFYPTAKDEIVHARIAEYKKQNKKIIRKQIQDVHRQLKDKFQDEKGQTYLMELDCWHWARYVENVLQFGHPGDEVIFAKQWDMLMLAPIGAFLHWEQFLYYFSAFLYKLFSIFKTIPLFTFLFYLPLFFTGIFIIVLYLFSFRYGKYIGAITSCLFVGLSPIFLQRSHAGWFDKDILNLLFPLLVVWTYILASASLSYKRRVSWICFSSFWVGLFSYNWTHWWFIFFIIIIYEFLYLGYLLFTYLYSKKGNAGLFKKHIFSLCAFIFFSFFWTVFLAGDRPLIVLYDQLREAFALNKPLIASIWPNVYSTVGELRRMAFPEIVRLIGGDFIFALSFTCIIILLVRALFGKTYTDFKRTSITMLAIWFVSMAFASSRGIRFIVFLLIPLSISLGWIINDLYEYFRNKKNIWAMSLVIIVFLFINATSVRKGYAAAKGIFPLMDDTWYKVLNIVKEKTPPNTILNSWWDFGDWFKVVARRRVIFDGQSQDTPQAYWMAKAMLADNENKAISILRMLNNGGNKAFEIIDGHLNDPLLSVLLLESVLTLPPERIQEVLLKFLPSTAAENVRKMLSYNPVRADFIVDHTMPYKMPAISYLGNWDFSKVYIAQNFDKKEKDRIIEHLQNLGRDEPEVQRFYQEVLLISTKKLDDWLSHRLQFHGPVANGREKDGIVFFDNGFVYNPREQIIQSNANQIPRSLFAVTDNNFVEKAYPNANLVFSILVFETQEGYKSILLDPELGRSIFVRLYFLNGKGLKHFLPFVDAQEGNNYIRVFDIVW